MSWNSVFSNPVQMIIPLGLANSSSTVEECKLQKLNVPAEMEKIYRVQQIGWVLGVAAQLHSLSPRSPHLHVSRMGGKPPGWACWGSCVGGEGRKQDLGTISDLQEQTALVIPVKGECHHVPHLSAVHTSSRKTLLWNKPPFLCFWHG